MKFLTYFNIVYYIHLLMTFTVFKSIWYTRRRQEKLIHNTICVGHHYAQTSTTGSKTKVLLLSYWWHLSILAILFRPFWFYCWQRRLTYLVNQSFNFERTLWRLFLETRSVHKLIYLRCIKQMIKKIRNRCCLGEMNTEVFIAQIIVQWK